MALVKTSSLLRKPRKKPDAEPRGAVPTPVKRRVAKALPQSSVETAAERIGSAAHELASGVAESASAAEELRRALEQIAAAAEESAGASFELLAAIGAMTAAFGQARIWAEGCQSQSLGLQTLLTEAAKQIDLSVVAVDGNAQRQLRAVQVISSLEQQAESIGQIMRTVADVSDQTGLLALNAAIEAARAGDHGRGFAVVADEVRILAETSERRAREVQDLAGKIIEYVRSIAARFRESANHAVEKADEGRGVAAQLEQARTALQVMVKGSQEVLASAIQANTAAAEAQIGAESVSSAATEQSAAAAQAQSAVQQQSVALDQSRRTAEALAALAEDLHSSGNVAQLAGQFGAAAEELSATVQELSGAASEILTAMDQISRGAQLQAAATQQASSAMSQIQKAAVNSGKNSRASVAQMDEILARLRASRAAVTRLTAGVADGLVSARAVLTDVEALEGAGRRIGKIVDALDVVAVQTTMLAVSGSVEAARAGDLGQGFALVSTDIRNLARESSENAERIEDLVQIIQDQVSTVRRDLDQLVAILDKEVQANTILDDRLAEVETSAVSLRATNEDIARSADAISASVSEVASGTQQIAAAAQETGTASAQAAISARQQSQGVEDLAAAVEEIALLAEELQKSGR